MDKEKKHCRASTGWLIILLLLCGYIFSVRLENHAPSDYKTGYGQEPISDEVQSRPAPPEQSLKGQEQIVEAVRKEVPATVFDDRDIKVTIEDVISADDGVEVVLLYENNSERNVRVNIDSVSANGYMMMGESGGEVFGQKKLRDSFWMGRDLLKLSGIDQIVDLELDLSIRETENEDKKILEDFRYRLRTPEADHHKGQRKSGVLLYNNGETQIKALGLSDKYVLFGNSAVYDVKNNSDHAITIYCCDMAINGYMINGITGGVYAILPGKSAIIGANFMDEELSRNHIKNIYEFSANFAITEGKNVFSTAAEKTGELTFRIDN